VTTDKHIRPQVSEVTLAIPVIILDVPTNDIDDVVPTLSALLAVLNAPLPARFHLVQVP
jgi:hypothetical protein